MSEFKNTKNELIDLFSIIISEKCKAPQSNIYCSKNHGKSSSFILKVRPFKNGSSICDWFAVLDPNLNITDLHFQKS
jgi:hypothetical protein